MKRFILTLALILAAVTATANGVRYFTRPQATRVARALDAQTELMIYCGYEYELATYVIINEVWAEPVNSKYYEIWLYGFDAYTGEEIYMPIDLSCIWLYNHYGNRMYNAAQYLRFRSMATTPNFYWTMPPYHSFVRHYHDPHFNRMYTYHYEVHRFGWRPPHVSHGAPAPLPPYYMRTPSTPAYVPTHPFTPGVNYPQTPDGHGYLGSGRNTTGTRNTGVNNSNGGERSGDNRSNAGNPGISSRNGNNNGNGHNTGVSNSRGNNVNNGTSTSRGDNTNSGTSATRGSNTNSGTSTTRGGNTNSGTSATRGGNTNNGTSTSPTRGNNTHTGTSTTRGTSTTNGTTTKSSTNTTNNNTATSTSRGTNTHTGTSTTRGSNNSGTTTTRGNNNSGTSSSRGTNTTTHTGSRNSR